MDITFTNFIGVCQQHLTLTLNILIFKKLLCFNFCTNNIYLCIIVLNLMLEKFNFKVTIRTTMSELIVNFVMLSTPVFSRFLTREYLFYKTIYLCDYPVDRSNLKIHFFILRGVLGEEKEKIC